MEGQKRCSCRSLEFVESSIGKKMLVAAAGLLLCGFLVTHLAGNLFLFVGRDQFNHYAKTLGHNPFLPIAEAALALLFVAHIALSLRARWSNVAARRTGYEMYRSKGGRSPGSRTIALTGLLVLAFLVVHIKSFRLAPLQAREDDLYKVVMDAFASPLYAGFYVLAMAGIGLHLSHGVQSAFQTFGINHPRYTPLIKKAGLAFAVLVALGFATMPVYFGFMNGGAK